MIDCEIPNVVAVEVVAPFTLRLTFKDGLSGVVDLSARLQKPVFESLRDPAVFELVEVDPEAGTIVWPNGLDWSPETLYDLVRSREPGTWWRETDELPRRRVKISR